MNPVKVVLYVEPEHLGMSTSEVRELALSIAEAYPNPGRFVSSFGFLIYTVVRRADGCMVEVTPGAGFHNLLGEPPINMC
jgi:hypothetical protein|tara:strand:- start:3915 stop:4154 length:240 start_codon:yes stop_codon:yes gene_type:complete